MATETAGGRRTADVTRAPDPRGPLGLLRAMLLMRGIEERAMTLYRQGKVPGSFYDGFGQEAVSAGAALAMAADDRLCILHRDLGRAHRSAASRRRGSSASTWAARAASRAAATATSTSATARVGCVGMVSMLPDMMLVATGLAMAFKLRGERASR